MNNNFSLWHSDSKSFWNFVIQMVDFIKNNRLLFRANVFRNFSAYFCFSTFVGLVFFALSAFPLEATAALVAAYSFNEGTGTTVVDSSGNGITGTISRATWTTAGKYGNALSFNGTSSYVNLGNPTSLRLTGSMTWSAWIKATANPGDDGQIISKSNNSAGWQLKTSPDTGPHTFGIAISANNNSHVQRYSNTVRALVTWYHVAGVYNASARTLDIYVNGVLDNGVLSGMVPSSQYNSSANVNIGRRSGGFYFNGIIDEVRVYNHALSQSEVEADMITPVGGTPAPNTPPTISSIATQTINEDTSTGALAFTIGDAQTAPGSLTVSGSSSNPTLVPNGNIVFGGSGANRTVTITPAANQSGTADITVTASDGQASTPTIFQLTVNTVNDAPTISTIANQTTTDGTAVGPLNFTIGDMETSADSLTVSGSSSNPTLVPDENIVFGGSGANRMVTITPAANQSGTADITVTVNDGQLSTPTSFQLTVNPPNTPPTISAIVAQTINEGTTTGAVAFTVEDAQTAADSLTVNGSSSNSTLVPDENIVFGGSGANRTVTITPAENQTGVTTITLTVSDGQLSTLTSFQVSVNATGTCGSVAAWNFDEGSGPVANDLSGNNNVASLGDVSAWAPGEYGSGIGFSGSSFLTVPSSPSVDIAGNALTLSMWINPQPLSGGDSVVLGKFWNATMTSPYYQYGIELTGGNIPNFFVGTAGGPESVSMGSSLPFSQWTHLAVVFDGSEVRFYLNSSLVSSQPLSANITARGNQMYIGADANGTQIFNGTLDNVRIYACVLTQTQIQTDMNTPIGGGSGTAPPTVTPVSITPPPVNGQVYDIVTLTAEADDDIGVAGVQFLVDGVTVGSEDNVLPYALAWDTRTVANGAHTLTARARDGSGNVAFSDAISVNVANTNFFQNEILATGFTLPTAIKFLPDGRMLVVELPGTIKVLPPPYTQPDPTPFLELNLNITGYAGYQQGIFDITFDPNFETNHYYYIFYTNDSPSRDRLSRFTANATLDGTVAGSELILYEDPEVPNTEHHGGAVNFGNDGKIYFTTGEHFNAGDAQLLSSPRGKIHRINSDGTIPTDNPFHDGTGPNWDSIWALGLRNPYRAYYDAPTDRLFIGDVGGNDYSTANEEVNVGVRGANYGWPDSEGSCSGQCTSPIYFYPHNGRDASVTGGFVYHGSQFPSDYQGSYFFADYTQNWIRHLTFDANGNVNSVLNFEPADGSEDGPYGDIVYLTEGPDGALYYVDLGYSDVGGTFGISKIRRIRYIQSNQAPVAIASASATSGPGPLTVDFSSNGSLDPEGQALSYAWTFGDNSTSTEANPTHAYTQNGQYTVRLSVSDGVNTTLAPPLYISVGIPPSVSITEPIGGSYFRAGDMISFSGNATDDGPLPASSYTWYIDFLHSGHVHPGETLTSSTSGTFTIPTTGHDFSGDTRYRITLTVTDSDGLQSSQAVLVYPDKVNLTFDTVPTGLTLYLDGIAHTAQFIYDTLIGFSHTIEARNQTQGANSYNFSSWSDGGAQTHSITVPSAAQAYAATYDLAPIPLPQGLVAAWGFSEGAGTSAGDSSGNGNTATLINGTSWVAGHFGTGLSFDGASNYLSVVDSTSLNISGNTLTLSMWINPQALNGGDSVVLGKFWNTTMTSPYYQYGLELYGGSTPDLFIGTVSGPVHARMGSTLPFDQWSHFAVVFNGAQAQFYVNGILTDTQPLSASITARGNQINIGADKTPAQFHKGLLDEVRIYNRALTVSEIQTDMTTPLP